MTVSLTNVTRSTKDRLFAVDRAKKNPSPQLAVRFDPATLKEIRRRAHEAKVPAARIVRDLLLLALSSTQAPRDDGK